MVLEFYGLANQVFSDIYVSIEREFQKSAKRI